MAHDLPQDWYEEHDGQNLVLNADKVKAEIERLRSERDKARSALKEYIEIASRPRI